MTRAQFHKLAEPQYLSLQAPDFQRGDRVFFITPAGVAEGTVVRRTAPIDPRPTGGDRETLYLWSRGDRVEIISRGRRFFWPATDVILA